VDRGDTVILPDMYWDNYPLILETRREASLVTFPLYNEAGGFNLEALRAALKKSAGGRCALLLNFPNNPTGYSPTGREAEMIVAAIAEAAATGTRMLVICDDAYFGLFYEEGTYTQSLFARLCCLHENVLAAKVDGSTKEDLTWGFRTGFITLGSRGLSGEQYDALTRKLMGAVRSTVSNSSILAQSLILRAMKSPDREGEKAEAYSLLKARYAAVKKIIAARRSDVLTPLPFNSGYFMSFRLQRGKAEDLRKALLMGDGVGTIAIDERCLRVAYSSVDVDKLEELYERIYSAAEKL
jgi:aspartate/methionine/tyrosine aminotransferase